MTAILLHTRGSILVAVIYHWLINASPNVVDAMFPAIDGGSDDVRWIWDLGVKVVVVVIFILVLGKNLTRKELATH